MRSARRILLSAAAVALLGAAVALPQATSGATADPYGEELMRLTNLDRQALGLATLAIDPTLAAFARDLPFTCPTDAALVVRGRARDMAERGYFSHTIPGCPKADGTPMSVLDVMRDPLGYSTTRGENIAWNSYPTGAATYAYGCALDGTACKGTTATTSTVEVAERSFMQSVGHRANILGGFDRFGCGSATDSTGRRYYSCVFSLGGPAATPTPTPAPDTTVPRVSNLTGTSVVHAGYGRTLGATATDNRALRRLEVRVDGRLARAWSLSGTYARRSVLVSSSWLWRGRHVVRWTVRDAAGNARTYSFWLYVR